MYKNSIQIARLNKPGITDFAAERNKILKSAKSEWVFFLDSDEKASSLLMKEAERAVKAKRHMGYYIRRENYFLGQHIGTDKIIRLGRKDSGKWSRKVHEVWQINGSIGELSNPVIHNTADSLFEYINKINRYASLHAEANKTEGKNSDLFKITCYPLIKFVQSIIMGRGAVFSILQAFHSFLSWSELWLLQRH